ncbi:MAG: translocation/assembly module TamB domain-containing protein [Deltaproteobacteria bacterium]|nr:translocation/assembly module TamB domain-containing protein [Deltaproteobacteria bacterium]MBN2672447.1 translocation/assembly module TamB domain-containing protein [Deltaproteobacteria bacterium]
MRKRIGKILLALVLVIGLLVAGALLFITSEIGSTWISQKVYDGLKRETGLEVTFRNIDLAFFPPRLLLEDLTARGAAFDAACTLDEAEVSPNALDLLRGRISIEEIYMGEPRCTVKLTESDMNKLREASKIGDDSSDKIDLSFLPKFDVVALSDGHFEVRISDPKGVGEVDVDVDGLYLDITGRHRGQDQIEIRALLEKASGKFDNGDVHIDEQINGIKIRAALDEDSLNIRTAEGNLAGITLDAQDVYVPVHLQGNKLNAMYFSVDVPLPMLARFPLDMPVMKGHAGFSGQVSALFATPEEAPSIVARGNVTLREVSVDDFVIGDLDGTVSYSDRGVAYSDVELRTAGGALKLSGGIEFDEDLSIESEVDLENIELAKLLENLTMDNSFVMQQMSGHVSVKGKLNGLLLRGTTDLDVRRHRVFDDGFRKAHKETLISIPEVSVRGPFTITEKAFAGNGFVVQRNNSLVNVDMEFFFGDRGWNLHAWSSRMDLGDVATITGFSVDGNGSLDCKINAPGWGTPYIDGSAAFKRMRFAGYDYSEVSTGVRFDGRYLLFENLDIRSRKSHYSTDVLSLDFESPKGLGVGANFNVERAELDDLARSYHLDTSQWGSPKGYFSGLLDIQYQTKPEKLFVKTEVTHEGLTLFNEVFGGGGIDATYDDGTLQLTRLDMTKGQGTVAITGSLKDLSELNFMGVVTDVRVEDIVYPLVSDLEIEGVGQVFAVLEGTVAHPQGRATVRLSDTTRHEMKFGASDLEVSLDGKVVQVQGTLADRMAVVEHSVFDFATDDFVVEAFVRDLNLAEIMDLNKSGSPVTLKLTGETVLSGRMEGPVQLNGMARIFDFQAAYEQFRFKNKATISITVANDRFTLKDARFLGDHVVFDIGGYADDRRFKLSAKGLANLQLVSRLTDTVSDSEGKLSFNVLISGPWDDPKFRGEAEVVDGNFEVAGFPNRIEDVSGKVVLGSNIIRLAEFTGKSAGGTLDMGGWISFDGLAVDDYRFNLALANLELQLMDELTLRASTLKNGLIMSPGKTRDIPFISGDVEISNFKYTEPVHIIEVSDLDVTGIGGKRKRTTRPKLFDKSKDVFEYDIRLHGDRNLMILNNLLDAQLKIDDQEEPLRLVGTNQAYGFLGRVLGVGGEVRFAGKTFEIQNAFVSFKDPTRPENPNFRVTADVDIRDWKVTITAEGTVEEYEVHLSSQPYLPQEDIVMLLLTGMTKQEHNALDSQGLAMSLAPILENVSSGAIPVEVNVYSEYSEKAGTETTRVALGKRITRDIWVQVSSSVGEEQDVEGTLSYKINDNVSVSASYDNKNETSKSGNWGLDLCFRLEF